MHRKETSDIRWGAILLAGGSGTRMRYGENKMFLQVGGVPVLIHALRRLLPHAERTVIVHAPGELERVQALLQQWQVPTDTICFRPGGEMRQASVFSGLGGLSEGGQPPTHVLVHDGARCIIPADVIHRVKAAASRTGAAIPVVPVTDTIKKVDDEEVLGTLDRDTLAAAQTPQGFFMENLRAAHNVALSHNFQGTDDASLLEHAGIHCTHVPGDVRNIKLTTPADVKRMEAMMQADMVDRVGFGFDVHQLVAGRKLILCGCSIPHPTGLLGHSDADVATHALMDAMLGAMGMGDIGTHFPDTDLRYKDADSMALLRHVVTLMENAGGQIINCDITIAAQKPKLAPHIPAMRENIAQALAIPLTAVNVKATTTEHLGFVGREEGISSQAVCMIRMPRIYDESPE